MAKHDGGSHVRSTPRGDPSRQPRAGARRGQLREKLHGFCIGRAQVLEGDDGGGPGSPVWCEGAPSGRAARVARRECRQPGDTRRPAGRGCRGSRAELGRRRPAGELPMVAATDWRWTSTRWPRSPPGCRRAGTRAPAGPGTGRRDRAGDVEQCRVAAVRGAVGQSASRRFSAGRWASWTCRAVGIDGGVFRDHCMVRSRWGSTHRAGNTSLGLREGATETAAVTTVPAQLTW